MKFRKFMFLIAAAAAAAISLTGCLPDGNTAETLADGEPIQVGKTLTVQPPENGFSIVRHMDTLSSDGLYYVSWGAGEAVDYENSDGNEVDLYDASLYLLLSENKSDEKAQSNAAAWLAAAEDNYTVENKEDLTIGDLACTLIEYRCAGEDNPYDRGVSAFAVSGSSALCVELTCLKDYDGDLRQILTGFLEGCTCNE